jgi:hypothetical protein
VDPAQAGYGHRLYVESFAHLAPHLPCRAGLASTTDSGAELHDAMGCYPLFDCDD